MSNLRGFSTVEEIFNLCGYFGDVVKILFLKKKYNAMIEFSSKNEAQKALSALNKKKIYNSKLILKFSRYHDQIYEFLECFDEPSKNQVFW